MLVQCKECGKNIKRKPSEIKNRNHIFCSRECKSKWQSKNLKGENNPSWKSGKVKCDWCGKEFHKPPSHIERNEHHFCSRECKDKFFGVGKRIKIKCEECGKEFEVIRGREKTARFCSQECMLKWRSEKFSGKNHPSWREYPKIECPVCGKEFEVKPSELEDRHFCSKGCLNKWKSKEYKKSGFGNRLPIMKGRKNPNWKGGFEPYYGPNWNSQAKKARERDEYTCQRCGVTEEELNRKLDVHHKKPIRKFRDKKDNIDFKEANKLSNLVSLCRHCHLIVEWESSK